MIEDILLVLAILATGFFAGMRAKRARIAITPSESKSQGNVAPEQEEAAKSAKREFDAKQADSAKQIAKEKIEAGENANSAASAINTAFD